ncbi:4-alpha-glucanotransferase [Pontibacter cellulosilyticus]|uniref:4-alpha-glucanotransferase n=1 Tax=Pontibacter cellulosilyticus TaxID=1720253 RepID=A0A923SI21_9BACT|nr:4-alpha-glucanotransferase [Pontibacter cellulosilyticus]MBC5992349.1 4-alpha-glucanotransferase [Pontibacter cellulosilyticus]
MIIPKRSSGLLLHITSLPSRFGIGDMGPEAYKFCDLLVEAGQRYWQILPLNPTEHEYGNSPYSSHSAFAGNPLLISPELLQQDGLLQTKDLETDQSFPEDRVDFKAVAKYKIALLKKSYAFFKSELPDVIWKDFTQFQKTHRSWLDDFARFSAYKAHFHHKSWVEWPQEIKYREEGAMQELDDELSEKIEFEEYLQFLVYRQWQKLKNYCNQKGIIFLGDMPFYVSHDSADVWANPKYFKLDRDGNPTAVSGVPPDYFSETGQLWGTPVYDWEVLQKHHFDWWIQRIEHNLQLFGLLRLDHFRAFSAYWEVPAGEETAIKGNWVKSPGDEILKIIKQKHHPMPIIAEDLGEIDQPVRDLIHKFDLPGMLVLLFAFGDDISNNPYAPHNHKVNSIVYTGTHDNNTVRGWYEKQASKEDKHRLSEYSNHKLNADNVADVMMHLALGSVAQLAILPVQDVLRLGADAVMNVPSTIDKNWEWRLKDKQFAQQQVKHLLEMTAIYGRCDTEKTSINNL